MIDERRGRRGCGHGHPPKGRLGSSALGELEHARVAPHDPRCHRQQVADEALAYEIRESAGADRGLFLELIVEGMCVARASASGHMLADMEAERGLSRETVAQQLKKALLDALRFQGQFVEVVHIIEDPSQPLRFSGRYTHRVRGEVATGLVWYDVETSATGPADLPAVVRNKMRFEVHRKLTDDGSAARALVDLHK